MSKITDLLYLQDDAFRPITLPSGREATVTEMTGLDQRALNDRGKMANGSAVNEVLLRCVSSVDGVKPDEADILSLPSADRKTLLFHIRKYSLGDTFEFKSKCPSPDCGQESEWEVNLNEQEFPITPYKSKDKTIEVDSKLIPGLRWKFSILDGYGEMRAVKIPRNKLCSFTDLELRNIQCQVNEEVWTLVNLDKAKSGILKELRDIISEWEGDLDDTVTLTCPKCGAEVKFQLILQPSFMIPGMPA